ncbi:MAG TPA: hypothetical protein HPP51_03125 [Planctomycetes bacterium]|nr:hypothetical protein [Planctomycetota bacterium]
MLRITAINLTRKADPDLFRLIDRFASVQRLKPTTAIKRYLSQTLPVEIKTKQRQNRLVGTKNQDNLSSQPALAERFSDNPPAATSSAAGENSSGQSPDKKAV